MSSKILHVFFKIHSLSFMQLCSLSAYISKSEIFVLQTFRRDYGTIRQVQHV